MASGTVASQAGLFSLTMATAHYAPFAQENRLVQNGLMLQKATEKARKATREAPMVL